MFTDKSKSLTKENILSRLDSFQLFRAYCPNFTRLNSLFCSELRNDKSASCVVTVYKGDLFYRDFGKEKGLRIFDYIGEKYNLNFTDVLKKINEDFNLGLGYNTTDEKKTSLVIPEKSDIDYKSIPNTITRIDIRSRDWTDADKRFWNSYQIPLKLLEYHNVKSISHYWITNEKKKMYNVMYTVGKYTLGYSYDYYWNNGVFRRKLYFPQLNDRRFVSNVDSTIVQGWTLLPKAGGDILFITKSYKDIFIFNLLGYWAIAPNNEGAYIPDEVMIKLKKRWKRIFVWYDNDDPGIEKASIFSEKYGLKWTYNPLSEPKDPSDYVKKYGLNQFDNLVNVFLNGSTS